MACAPRWAFSCFPVQHRKLRNERLNPVGTKPGGWVASGRLG